MNRNLQQHYYHVRLMMGFACYAVYGAMFHFGQLDGDTLINWLIRYYIG